MTPLLRNVLLFHESFEFLIDKRNENSIEAWAKWICQRSKVLAILKRRRVILANVCPIPTYSGIENTVTAD